MLLFLNIVNIILFCASACFMSVKYIDGLNKGIKLIAAIIIALIIVSYLYYLSVSLSIDFTILTGTFLVMNILLVSANIKAYKNIFAGTVTAGITNRDVVFPLFIVLLLTGFFFADTERWGQGDAITIWNMHAQYLFYAGSWKNLFQDGVHPDYPLMLPALIAFFWKTINNISPFVPVFVTWFPLLFIPLLSYFALYQTKNNWLAWLCISIFLLNNNFIMIALAQGADTLLALLILLSFILFTKLKSSSKNILFMLGFIAAATTWVKNEGILFFVIFTLVFVVCHYKDKSSLKNYFIGTIIPVIVLISFKLCYPPPNDLVSNAHKTGLLLHHLADYHRYFTIARFMAATLFYYYIDVLILLMIILIINPLYFKSPVFIVMALAIAGYCIIYVTTPLDLHWHLYTSADRVLQHYYPAMVYTIILSVQTFYNKKAIAV